MSYVLIILGVILGLIVLCFVGYSVLTLLLFRNDPLFRALDSYLERSHNRMAEIINKW